MWFSDISWAASRTLALGARWMTWCLTNWTTDRWLIAEPASLTRGFAGPPPQLVEHALGPEHPHVAASLENYVALLRETARADEAERMEARAKAIRAKPE